MGVAHRPIFDNQREKERKKPSNKKSAVFCWDLKIVVARLCGSYRFCSIKTQKLLVVEVSTSVDFLKTFFFSVFLLLSPWNARYMSVLHECTLSVSTSLSFVGYRCGLLCRATPRQKRAGCASYLSSTTRAGCASYLFFYPPPYRSTVQCASKFWFCEL